MKKYFIVLLAFLTAVTLCLAVTVSASEIDAQTQEQSAADGEPAEGEELPAEVDYASDTWADEAKMWIGEHFAGIVTALAALYAVLPKYGGIAAVVGVVRSARNAIAAFGTYIDDKKNPNSIYNVLDRMGGLLGKFMGDASAIFERLEAQLVAMNEGKVDAKKLCEVMMAVEESTELMGKEFAKLLSISTTVPLGIKSEMEKEFMAAQEHLHCRVKGALGDDGQKEETVA